MTTSSTLEYFRTSILGEFPEKMPIFEAFLLELRTINEMSIAMGRPPLFRKVPELGVEAKKKSCIHDSPDAGRVRAIRASTRQSVVGQHQQGFLSRGRQLEFEEERPDGRILVRPEGTASHAR